MENKYTSPIIATMYQNAKSLAGRHPYKASLLAIFVLVLALILIIHLPSLLGTINVLLVITATAAISFGLIFLMYRESSK